MHDDDKPTKMSIELRGGPLHNRVLDGPHVPTTDGYPVHFEIKDELTVLAGGVGVVPTIFDLPIGFYAPTGHVCDDGHRVFIWIMPNARWN